MERAIAVKKLRRMIGKGFGYQIDANAPTAEERAAAKAESPVAVKTRTVISEKLTARRAAILNADTEYQELLAAYNVASKRCDELTGIMHRAKITVGTANNLFFHVSASGDSWEDVIEKLSKKK